MGMFRAGLILAWLPPPHGSAAPAATPARSGRPADPWRELQFLSARYVSWLSVADIDGRHYSHRRPISIRSGQFSTARLGGNGREVRNSAEGPSRPDGAWRRPIPRRPRSTRPGSVARATPGDDQLPTSGRSPASSWRWDRCRWPRRWPLPYPLVRRRTLDGAGGRAERRAAWRQPAGGGPPFIRPSPASGTAGVSRMQ